MTKPVIITSDDTCDLSPELKERYGIKIFPLIVSFGEETFRADGNFSAYDVYARYRRDGILPKTSAPGIQEFVDFFAPLVEAGYEVVHLDISGELSGTYNCARIAAQEFEGVYTVDSRSLSTGVGLLAIEGAECRDKGMSAKEIAEHLTELTAKLDVSFVLDTLEFMRKGGRCSGFEAVGANILKIKPNLEMKDGLLVVCKKYRGDVQNVYGRYIRERMAGKEIRPGHIFITDSGEVADEIVEKLKAIVLEAVPDAEVHHTTAGCIVASHCGPKTLGVLFIKK